MSASDQRIVDEFEFSEID